MTNIQNLQILSILGFKGTAINSLCLHPDEIHLIYPCGISVIIFNRDTREQNFLNGHTGPINCVALSPSGSYVASGQDVFRDNENNYYAPIIIWDFKTRVKLFQYEVHMDPVEYLIFSCSDEYVISLGRDSNNCVAVYDINNRKAHCGGPASGSNAGLALTVATLKRRPNYFLTGGIRTLRLWHFNVTTIKVSFREVAFNEKKGDITAIVVDSKDEFAYCGTTSGVIIKIILGLSDGAYKEPIEVQYFESQYKLYTKINCIVLAKKGELLVGSADGAVIAVQDQAYSSMKHKLAKIFKYTENTMLTPILSEYRNVGAGISSMRLTKGEILIGTLESEIFQICRKTWKLSMLITSHRYAIEDIAFPSGNIVRILKTETCQELLRIRVTNTSCLKVIFHNGSEGIITSWRDKNIRAYNATSGQLIFTIKNAHMEMVRAIGLMKNGKTLVSGSGDGQVRIWDISSDVQKLKAVLKGHNDSICDIAVNHASDEIATASDDGTCIIWDIMTYARKKIIYASNTFISIAYHPTGCELLTAEEDERISFWKVSDGSLIRKVDCSSSDMYAMDISSCGAYFLTVGHEKMVKVWKYNETKVTYVGLGHATFIATAHFSPDSKFIVSASKMG